ncbi:hypothetical protein DPEC_G00304380 [Dallia pectoralis]|uniref:Uncharacterized protein n=1 Tax=Dallia pectoralis TaxID=75939 RepID=A0ACC2FDL8_DALPE|nr:hypothetical protein DPEC_G00304380 [Dallia pectoralis]
MAFRGGQKHGRFRSFLPNSPRPANAKEQRSGKNDTRRPDLCMSVPPPLFISPSLHLSGHKVEKAEVGKAGADCSETALLGGGYGARLGPKSTLQESGLSFVYTSIYISGQQGNVSQRPPERRQVMLNTCASNGRSTSLDALVQRLTAG